MKSFVLVLGLLLGLTAFAQESVPTFETVVKEVIFNTSDKVVIDEKTIKESRAPSITSLLSSQANVTVVSTPYQPNSIFIRGGDAGHVMIIVDGVPFYDASTIQRTFNLNSLDIKAVRRIEIIKGGQTVLYGGQALTGVIKIDTIPQEFKTQTGLQGQIGTQDFRDITATHTEALNENNAFMIRGHGAWRDAESPVLNSSQTYARNNWNGSAVYAWKGAVEGNIKGTFLQDLNFSPNASAMTSQLYDTENFEQYTRQLGASSHIQFKEVPWSPRLTMSIQNSLREYNWPTIVPVDNPDGTNDDYGADLKTLRLDITPYQSEQVSVVAGVSYLYEDFVYRAKGVEKTNTFSEQRGLFTKLDYQLAPGYSLAIGGRVENWADQDPVGTYQIGLTLFTNTKIEVTSGYKIPSLFQLYSRYGNSDLKAERGMQYSLLQEWNISDRQNFSATFFYSEFSDLIQATGSFPSMKYNNISKANTRGVDLTYTFKPTAESTLLATYGYQEPRDDNDRWLLRRPLVNGSIKYLQNWDRHSGTLEFVGAGTRTDKKGTSQIVTIPGYVIANAAYSYRWSDTTTLFSRLNNLTDYRYEETYSFYSEGFSGSLGFEIWF